jgi:undecaprenyl-diphosphatase
MLAFIATYLCLFSRVDGFILLNSFHTQTLHSFFNSVTFIGDGLFTIILSVIIVVFYKKHSKLALLLIIAYLSSGIFAQIFKAIIYAPRPAEYFKLHNYNYYLDTFANSRVGTNSFPSGHASSAFAMVTIFSIYCKRKFVCYSFLLIGILAGYSRIYLAHHFLIDVFGGAILGILFGSLTYIWIDKNWNAIVGFFTQKIFRSISRQIPNMPSIE